MATRKEQIAVEVAKAVGAGKVVSMETVDFNDPNRPKTCLEVDFPILPVNQVAIIEGNAGKPIYQMSKWWARRRSSVFRSMLIAAATKAPEDRSHAAKLVWDNYYANHQKKGAFNHLKVADIFMGGGTTLVEGSRLGMQMTGNDLNPVAWFVVKQELANVDIDEVKRLLADIEAEVKPQIMPYYYCDGPNGDKGIWTHLPSKKTMPAEFDPLILTQEQRREYSYEGPEAVYTFWGKHGPCQVTGCGHRTPIMMSPVMAIKTLSVKYWEHKCDQCGDVFDVEEVPVRMAPEAPLYVAPTEKAFTTLDRKKGVVCPHCEHASFVNLGKGKNKKVELSLLVHPEWLAGSPKLDKDGLPLGGSAQDSALESGRWNKERASKIRLLEVRGKLPNEVTCPETNLTFKTDVGTIPKRSHFSCSSCGTVQDLLKTIKAYGKTAPFAGYAVQAYSPNGLTKESAYNGRFFAAFDENFERQYTAASHEWETRKNGDLANFWPKSAIPIGAEIGPHDVEGHHFTHWWTMFNPRQMLVHAQLLKAITEVGTYSWSIREYVLGAFQQYLRNQSLFSFWHTKLDKLAPALSNSNFHPKSNVVEVGVFSPVGYGPWSSTVEVLSKGNNWAKNPWELVAVENLRKTHSTTANELAGKSEKIIIGDPVLGASLTQGSSTELNDISDSSIDLVITDPPFGDLVQYSELADFFYVWLRLVLQEKYPNIFSGEYTPKTLEAVANRYREPEDPNGFYQRLLTQCWRESNRILKPGGILAFTFHHSEDEPWVAVLESLFNAGFYLEATYPIRSDETKGEGQFGSQKVEYDIIHVCRKRTEEPTPVSWGRMRREVMADVRQLQTMLENHVKEGLPAADIQVIRRGKALEYFSRHYGKVYVDEGQAISVRDALIGINQLIDEDADKGKEAPPVNLEPMSRQFLRTFDGKPEIPRDQLQKFLKGSITTPDEFVQRGWCTEKNKLFTLVEPLDFARDWQGKHKRKLTSDLDQALVLIGACFDGSGINTADTLNNDNFKPHAALKPLLDWMSRHGATAQSRTAATRALTIYNNWAAQNQKQVQQMTLFFEEA
jgi:adenine-specific DNA methylase